jgi:hypothetical protein
LEGDHRANQAIKVGATHRIESGKGENRMNKTTEFTKVKTRAEMKTPIELISHLDKHATQWRPALLIIGFPKTTSFVPSDCNNRLKMLEDLLQQGGIPVGVMRADLTDDKAVFCCILEDRTADKWVDPYIKAIATEFLNADPDQAIAASIGIEAFQSRDCKSNTRTKKSKSTMHARIFWLP